MKLNCNRAVQYSVESWQLDIKETSIFNCFLKSSIKVFGPQELPLHFIEATAESNNAEVRGQIQGNITQLQGMGLIREAMAMDRFLNPVEETVSVSVIMSVIKLTDIDT